MNPYEFTLSPGGNQRVNFLPIIPILAAVPAALGGLATGAVSLASGAVGALGSAGAFLGETAIGAGGTVLSGIGQLGGGIIETTGGIVTGAGELMFGGPAAVPVMTGGEMGSLSLASAGGTSGGVFGGLTLDTLGNVASLGYNLWQTGEQRKLAEKMIEAQSRAGYVVGAPGTTALSPTTSIALPAAAAAAKELDTKVMIKYAIYALIAYLLFKGFK